MIALVALRRSGRFSAKRRMRPVRPDCFWADSSNLPSFLVCEAGGFLFSKTFQASRWSLNQNRSVNFSRNQIERSAHEKNPFAGLRQPVRPVRRVLFAATFAENFTNNPALDGWQVFGDTNLFGGIPPTSLEVTWDSSQPNSYFYLPLGTILTRNDDFSLAFDLNLSKASTGDSTGPLSLALGFLNLTNAMDPGFERGAGVSPNIAEFDYYPAGYFPPSYPSPATATPGFVDSTSSAYAPDDLSPYQIELPTNVVMHIAVAYTASNQTATLTMPPTALRWPNFQTC